MTAPATTAEPPFQSGPHQAPAQPATPPRIAAMLGLVHFLLTFGRDLYATLQHTPPHRLQPVDRFGTTNMPAILARIMRGLLRADALHRMLCRRAAIGRDIVPPPVRVRPPRAPGAARPTDARRAAPVDHPDAPHLPSLKQIEAEVRRRPIGAILADICDDLGLTPGLVGARWEELRFAIAEYGGNLACLFRRIMRRCLPLPAIARPGARLAPPAPPLLLLPATPVPSAHPP